MRDKLNHWAARAKDFSLPQSGDDNPWRLVAVPLAIVLVLLVLLGMYWSVEPDPFDVEVAAAERAPETTARLTTGSYTTSATIMAMETDRKSVV